MTEIGRQTDRQSCGETERQPDRHSKDLPEGLVRDTKARRQSETGRRMQRGSYRGREGGREGDGQTDRQAVSWTNRQVDRVRTGRLRDTQAHRQSETGTQIRLHRQTMYTPAISQGEGVGLEIQIRGKGWASAELPTVQGYCGKMVGGRCCNSVAARFAGQYI